jgi:DNA-binding response OmpR family regulator
MHDNKYVIGIVDDDESFRDSTSYFLDRYGYEVRLFESGIDFMKQYETNARLQHELDLIILDVLMPGLNGDKVLDQLKSDARYSGLKVIIMSSENTLENRVDLIEAGADDFTAKSDTVFELLARVKARLRETTKMPEEGVKDSNDEFFEDVDSTIFANKEPLNLTNSEYLLLSTLVRNLEHYVKKEDLGTIVFGDYLAGRGRALDFHLTRIRAKLSKLELDNAQNSPTISTRRGYGVKLSVSADSGDANNAS